MTAWPASLPTEGFSGVGIERKTAVVRSSMDSGPAKQRARFTAAVRELQVPMFFTGTELQTFDTFFITTLSEGALSFDWLDPVNDSTVSMRFMEPPKFQQVSGGASADRVWRSTFKLEILP